MAYKSIIYYCGNIIPDSFSPMTDDNISVLEQVYIFTV